MQQPADDLDLRNPVFVARSRSAESGNSPPILAPLGRKSKVAGGPKGRVANARFPVRTSLENNLWNKPIVWVATVLSLGDHVSYQSKWDKSGRRVVMHFIDLNDQAAILSDCVCYWRRACGVMHLSSSRLD
jgi:hypothetical protein